MRLRPMYGFLTILLLVPRDANAVCLMVVSYVILCVSGHHLPALILELFGRKKHIRTLSPANTQGKKLTHAIHWIRWPSLRLLLFIFLGVWSEQFLRESHNTQNKPSSILVHPKLPCLQAITMLPFSTIWLTWCFASASCAPSFWFSLNLA